MTSIGTGIVWFAALVNLAICVIVIIGALNRWTWLYYVVLVFLGIGVISIPLDLISAAAGSGFSGVSGYSMPSWIYSIGIAASIPNTALFVWMLVAVVRRGPWAMTRPAVS